MNPPRGFDRLAPIYRALEYVAFGRDLERARFAHLGLLHDRRSILVLGEGDGRSLTRIAALVPHARIDCLDLSTAMLERAKARLAGSEAEARVTFRQADLLTVELPYGHYDAVVTLFLLDCFTVSQASAIVRRIEASLKPSAIWLWADFAIPEQGWQRWRARVWVMLLYLFFRWQTGLEARELPPVDRLLAENGWKPLVALERQQGLLRSIAWRRADPG